MAVQQLEDFRGRALKKYLTIALLVLVANVTFAAEPREVADAIAAYVVASDDASIYERTAPSARGSVSLRQFTAASAALRAVFGNPKEVTYWRTSKGSKQSGTTRTPITVVWYHLVTDKYAENHALTVTLVEEGGDFYVQGYNFMRNMGKAGADPIKDAGA